MDNDDALDRNFEFMEENLKDKKFKRFQRTLLENPQHIFRYERGGEPLHATDYSHAPGLIPPCQLCGSKRHFELQLMPHLITLINVDSIGQSIDWATVMVYTCSKNCKIKDGEYAKEYVFKQDFVLPNHNTLLKDK